MTNKDFRLDQCQDDSETIVVNDRSGYIFSPETLGNKYVLLMKVMDEVLQEQYRIVSYVGGGGAGHVVKVYDIEIERECALKFYQDPQVFSHELSIFHTIKHPVAKHNLTVERFRAL